MGRLKFGAAMTFYAACRGVARFLPVAVVYALLLPYGLARGWRAARVEHKLPVSRLPASDADPRPGYLARWRFHTAIHHRWLLLFWSDRWASPRWASRFSVSNGERLDRLTAERGVIVITVHTGAMILLGGWLASRGLGVGSVIVDPRVWARMEKFRDNPRWKLHADSEAFLRGDARSMTRYLRPGRVLFLPSDHAHGHLVDGDWEGGRLRLSNGAFRIARLTDAAVLPIVVTETGRWRFHVHVGEPVPQALIEADDLAGAASHVAQQIMPIAATRPQQAAVTLVGAALPPP